MVQCLVYIGRGSHEDEMRIAVSDAKAQLTELVRQAEAGEDIILTRHGQPTVRLVPIRQTVNREQRRRLLDAVQASAAEQATPGENAARSQDFLYDENGLPR